MSDPPIIRPMTEGDWKAVAAIYVQGIAGGHATFATEPAASWQEWSASKLPTCRLVAMLDGKVVGWAALSPTSSRHCYRGVVELSIYVADEAQGKGIGSRLLPALVECSEAAGIWTLQAGIFAENTTSLRLHERCGFRVVGVMPRLGLMERGPLAGQWRDVVLMQRRSEVVGV